MADTMDFMNKGNELTDQDKAIALFKYLIDFNKTKQKSILNIKEYPWHLAIGSIPNDPENIQINYRDRIENEEYGEDLPILSVHKPEFQKCPEPDPIFKDWLLPEWEDYRKNAKVRENVQINLSEINNLIESESIDKRYLEDPAFLATGVIAFDSIPERVEAFEKWKISRNEWVKKQLVHERTRDIFSELYRLFFDIKRDAETMEIVAANGFIKDSNNKEINHPVITHRVKIDYNADENTVNIYDTDVASRLCADLLQSLVDINTDSINSLMTDLAKNDYHPFDRNDLPVYLKVLVHQLSSDSEFSMDGEAANNSLGNRLFLYWQPCFIVRKKQDGTVKAIEKIIDNVKENGYVPKPIQDIVSGGRIEIPEYTGEEPIEEKLASVGGESVDILLSKEANKEQLEIAKRIERYNAVLVQGPPGTGKTHTIANLMGHFIAQGKSVLVTSYTTKALSVLKEKVAPGLQNLCVSSLDDSNVDMEKSVDGITEYMAHKSSFEVAKEMQELQIRRKDVIKELAEVRKKIYTVINQENGCISYNGENISPSAVAKFVVEHTDDLSYIPGKVRKNSPLPLTYDQLAVLYRSNEEMTTDVENELNCEIPAPAGLLEPLTFDNLVQRVNEANKHLIECENKLNTKIHYNALDSKVEFEGLFSVPLPEKSAVEQVKDYCISFSDFEEWMIYAAVDGKAGSSYKRRWEEMISQIKKTCENNSVVVSEQIKNCLSYQDRDVLISYKPIYESIKAYLETKGKITKLALTIHRDFEKALDFVSVNGHQINSVSECDCVLHVIALEEERILCAKYWDELVAKHGKGAFFDLDENSPENIAEQLITQIEKYLNWYANEYVQFSSYMNGIYILPEVLIKEATLTSEKVRTENLLKAINSTVPHICEVFLNCIIISEAQKKIDETKQILRMGRRSNSRICKKCLNDLDAMDVNAYATDHNELIDLYDKYTVKENRKKLLDEIENVAPEWANAISNRIGIHGEYVVPETVEDAWKWKQFSYIVEDLLAEPFSDLQEKSLSLSKEYRDITADYAEKSGWYHLLKATEADIDMKQALQGWKMTVKKVGKRLGKNAPMYLAEARRLMAKCQKAVPAWIMPISKALESLTPGENLFDIVIIDEASQSDISSLPILYLGKKLIVVGDDKQVSPLAVGVDTEKIKLLQDMYLKDVIPNYRLYDAKTSIYGIASTTFQPLMLREHFRCVPDIIGFSNMLSYDYQIKPLRDASNCELVPAVVNYYVDGGERTYNKTNPKEAKTIVALLKACMEQPEYNGKTFGVISLLGDNQVKEIQREIDQEIDPKEIMTRSLLCGNSAHFQGDERDVILLSMVDSGTGNGPLSTMGFGVEDSTRKRYNVAVSRARDQLWIVNSLDAASDLKPGDIRKMLLDYARNPKSEENRHNEIIAKSDSPFETEVVSALKLKGFHLVQQWEVGAYRLDMVALCGDKKVAIECDGERWHSGESKIREDMERQTILERLGWRFIRIRGSEYYSNKEKTIERVISELGEYGIEPEDVSIENEASSSELLERVKRRAAEILAGDESVIIDEQQVIEIGLDPKQLLTLTPKKDFSASQKSENFVTVENVKEKINEQPREVKQVLQKKAEEPEPERISEVVKPRNHPASNNVQKTVITEKKKEGKAVSNPPKTVPKETEGIEKLFEKKGIEYVDKRDKGGALWVIGDESLKPVMVDAKKFGLYFHYKPDGSKSTGGKPGWWAK